VHGGVWKPFEYWIEKESNWGEFGTKYVICLPGSENTSAGRWGSQRDRKTFEYQQGVVLLLELPVERIPKLTEYLSDMCASEVAAGSF
jgi:hypothetical protein